MVPERQSGHHRSMTLKVLIVDDSELICAGLVGLLQGLQGVAAIYTASTLAQTLKCLRRELPTLLILDPTLQDCNAIQLIDLMKKMMPGMLIAVLANDPSEFNRKKSLRAGADWFFDKASEIENLLDVVQRQAALNSKIHAKEG